MTAVKELYRIRLRKSAKGYTFRCSCGDFSRRATDAGIERLAERHAWMHAQLGQANMIERGGLLNGGSR